MLHVPLSPFNDHNITMLEVYLVRNIVSKSVHNIIIATMAPIEFLIINFEIFKKNSTGLFNFKKDTVGGLLI